MIFSKLQIQHIHRCGRSQFYRFSSRGACRNEFGDTSKSQSLQHSTEKNSNGLDEAHKQSGREERGAMSRRLDEISEDSVEGGGRRAQKIVEEAGFSDELKRKLEARIEDSKFRSDKFAEFAQINMPSASGKGTRDLAAAQSWKGTENIEDAALRMLDDAHKPLRKSGSWKIPTPRGIPSNVDLRMRKAVQKSQAERLANARDRTSIYALSQDSHMSEKEREQMRKQLKERFTPARPVPGTIQGLAALANERIEDAIARGQFRNIPRGKGTNIERDHTASSPFLDTTEYFMNKIIQKQDIVPPWIEKQQELVKTAAVFRGRLRADWKRHAARVIASKGGSLASQVARAQAYAAAEVATNPRKPKVKALSELDDQGKVTQLTIKEETAAPDNPQDTTITITNAPRDSSLSPNPLPSNFIETSLSPSSPDISSLSPSPETEISLTSSPPLPTSPFRDPPWLALETPYLTLALASLNSLTRSYNLMAPALAQKPYFSLDRELRACYADVAPQLPNEIRARASAPPERVRVEVVGHKVGGVLERFGGEKVRVWEGERGKRRYGFRELWRDWWGGGNEEKALSRDEKSEGG